MFFFFDTETTGLPKKNKFKKNKIFFWPRIIQITWQIYNKKGQIKINKNYYIKPFKTKYIIPKKSINIHGITNSFLKKNGVYIKKILKILKKNLKFIKFIICHNSNYDINILIAEYFRFFFNKEKIKKLFYNKNIIDTQKILFLFYNKWLPLKKMYYKFYKKKYKYIYHNAFDDTIITILCFLKLIYYKIIIFNFKLNLLNFYKNIPLNIKHKIK